MNNDRQRDLLSYEIQAQALRQQAFADLRRATARAVVRAAGALRAWLRPKVPAAPATRPI